jgi:hypothetical protein
MKNFSTASRKILLFTLLLLTGYGIQAQSDYSKVRLALNGGWGYRTARTAPNLPSELKSIINGLRSGVNYGADVMVYFSKNLGAGVKYTGFNSSETAANGMGYNGFQKANTSTNFIAGTFGGRVYNKKQTGALHIALSLGYLGYKDEYVFNSQQLKTTGGTFGAGWDLGYDIRLTDKIWIGAQFSLISGVLHSYTQDNGITRERVTPAPENRENLGRIDLSAGIRFIL